MALPLEFPASPTDGDIFTSPSGQKWIWVAAGPYWKVYSDNIAVGSNVTVNTTAFTVGNSSLQSTSLILGGQIVANGSSGSAGQVLHSNGAGVYWAADDAGVTSVATGSGLTGGTITTTGTISVLANSGIAANATGVYVVPGNGLVAANSTGVHVGAGSGISVNTTAVSVLANSGIAANATGVYVVPGNGLVAANSTGVHVGAGSGISVNTTAVSVLANSGITTNATGVYVNTAYIGTLTANNADFFGGLSSNNFIKNNSLVHYFNSFIPSNTINKYYSSITTNRLLGRAPLLDVTIDGVSNSNAAAIFCDGSFENNLQIGTPGGPDIVVNINFVNNSLTGPSGFVYSSGEVGVYFYPGRHPQTLAARFKDRDGVYYPATVTNTVFYVSDPIGFKLTGLPANYMTDIELILTPTASANIWITEVEYHGSRMNLSESPVITVGGGNFYGSINVSNTAKLVFAANSGISANGTLGTSGHVLHSNGSAVYWAADDTGVTSVATGSGLTGGTITNTGTVSVLANTGITANATGLYVTQGIGTVVNATGVHVNSTYIGTLTANNATNLNGQPASYYTNATNLATGTVPTARLGSGTANSTTFLSGDQTYKTAITSLATGSGLTGGDIITSGTISVLANNGITANTAGLYVTQGTGIVVNSTGVHVNSAYVSSFASGVNTAATYAWTNTHSFSSNVNFDSGTLFVDSVANRVGVGTGAGAPTYALDVEIAAAAAQHWFDATEGGPAYYGANGMSGAEYRAYVNGVQYGKLVTNSTAYALVSTNAVPVIIGANNINYVFVAANGSVGIGNSSPAHSLRVDGTISLSGGVHANGSLGTSGQVLHSNGTGVYWAADDTGVTSVATGSGLTGGTITTTGTVSVLANNGITANATGLYVTQGTGLVVNTTGVHVNSGHVATLAGSPTFNSDVAISNSLLSILRSNNEFSVGLRAGTTSTQTALTNIPVMILHNTDTTNNNGVGIRFNTNDTGGTERTAAGFIAQFTDHTTSSINADLFFYTANDSVITEKFRIKSDGNVGIGNSAPIHKLRVEGDISLSGALVANNSNGTSGQVLHSNGTGIYWAADDQGVTSVATGVGLTGGTITTTGTVSVLANNGITANTTGLFVTQGTGTVVNSTGVHVNGAHVATLAGSPTFTSAVTVNNSNLAVTNSTGTAIFAVDIPSAFGDPYQVRIGGVSVDNFELVVFGNTFVQGTTRTGAILANNSLGTSGQVLTSNGTGIYWATPTPSPSFPSGTLMLFVQTAAPTGWTKSTTHNNKALRVVSGTASSGGTVAFTTAFASQAVSGTVGNTTLTTAMIPSHNHRLGMWDTVNEASGYGLTITGGFVNRVQVSVANGNFSANTGDGGSHGHSFTGTAINLAVQYVDVIIATKD